MNHRVDTTTSHSACISVNGASPYSSSGLTCCSRSFLRPFPHRLRYFPKQLRHLPKYPILWYMTRNRQEPNATMLLLPAHMAGGRATHTHTNDPCLQQAVSHICAGFSQHFFVSQARGARHLYYFSFPVTRDHSFLKRDSLESSRHRR